MPCPPIADADWPEAVADLLPGFAGQLNIYRVMAHRPELLRAWAPLREHLVRRNALGPERAEIVILRTGVRLGSAYEWAHHVHRSRALGMPDARIAATRDMPEGEDGLLCRAVDALYDGNRLPEALEAELAGALGRDAVFDLIALVGFYATLGRILMTYDVPLDAEVAEALSAAPL